MLFGGLIAGLVVSSRGVYGLDTRNNDDSFNGNNALDLANKWLKENPILDCHIDVPETVRDFFGDNIDNLNLDGQMPNEFDIPRARTGHLGGLFWSVWTKCQPSGPDFTNASWSVRDAFEQFDVALELIDKYSDTFKLVLSADDAECAIREGKIASLIGVEGGHQLGNSLGVLRDFQRLGMRYLTLTHTCNNALGDSGGSIHMINGTWGGLSPFGHDVVKELNRLGVLADLSHVSDQTALDVMAVSQAPVIFTHSDARAVANVARNVPDVVLDKIGTGPGKIDAVLGSNFYPPFLNDQKDGTLEDAVKHIQYISNRIGKQHLAIGSDYDGASGEEAEGLENASKYPALFAELIKLGWTKDELAGLAHKNVLRILRGAEKTAREMKNMGPLQAFYGNRTDLKIVGNN